MSDRESDTETPDGQEALPSQYVINSLSEVLEHDTLQSAFHSCVKTQDNIKILMVRRNSRGKIRSEYWFRKTPSTLWLPDTESRLERLSSEYEEKCDQVVFWVRQRMTPRKFDVIKFSTTSELTKAEKSIEISLSCYCEVITETQFKQRFALK